MSRNDEIELSIDDSHFGHANTIVYPGDVPAWAAFETFLGDKIKPPVVRLEFELSGPNAQSSLRQRLPRGGGSEKWSSGRNQT